MTDIFLHNWLYSVVPARVGQDAVYTGANYALTPSLEIYLAGYCRNCGRAFSQPIPYGGYYIETNLNIPKEGCVGPS